MFKFLKKKISDVTVGETIGLSLALSVLAVVPFVAPAAWDLIDDKIEEMKMKRHEPRFDEEDE